jgi:hypothetical protein
MDFKEFKEKFNPLILNESEVGLKQLYVPSSWPESRVLLAYPTNCLWTLVQEEGKLYLKNDLHFLGRIANIITEKVWVGDRNTFKIEI